MKHLTYIKNPCLNSHYGNLHIMTQKNRYKGGLTCQTCENYELVENCQLLHKTATTLTTRPKQKRIYCCCNIQDGVLCDNIQRLEALNYYQKAPHPGRCSSPRFASGKHMSGFYNIPVSGASVTNTEFVSTFSGRQCELLQKIKVPGI